MTGRGNESDLLGTFRRGGNPPERTFPTYAKWLLREAIVGPKTSCPPSEEKSDFDDELFQQVETFNEEEEDEDHDNEVLEEIERYRDGDGDLPMETRSTCA